MSTREYTFPDPKTQEQKEEIKGALMGCVTVEDRKTIFFAYVLDMTYKRTAIHQALKECGFNDDFTVKSEGTKC